MTAFSEWFERFEAGKKPSVVEIVGQVERGEVTAEAVTKDALARIERCNPELNAFLSVSTHALEAARAIDSRRANGEKLGRLAGVPIGIKDAICTTDMPTTAGSRILLARGGTTPEHAYRSPYDATVIERLRAEDAIILGKCNMDEFAMGSSTEHSAFGVTRNPHDPSRAPGGSSGGSAVAVAAGMVPVSLGSDTGGSIRQPASFTGTFGFKPTYGRVSRYGLIAFASSLDQIGVFSHDVASAARVMSVISGRDAHDMTSLDVAPIAETAATASAPRIGIPKEYFGEGLSPAVKACVDDAIAKLVADGAVLVPVSLPHTAVAVSTYYVLATAEASSNLSRFDGIRFGARANATSLDGIYGETRAQGFGDEVKRRILLGTFVLSAGYYDAYYKRATAVRKLIAQDFARAFEKVDFLLTPTSPTVAFKLGERTSDPLAMYLADIFTVPASLAGLPAASLPAGRAAADDEPTSALPVGLQVIGARGRDAEVLAYAERIHGRLVRSPA